jgi:transcriptional regulator with XRE-family HTH domain
MTFEIPKDINKLKLFLFLNNVSARDLARAINYAPATISNYIAGKRPISRRVAALISEYTLDSISIEELLADNPKKDFENKEENVIQQDT